MLEKQNARLDIKAVQGETGEPCRIVITSRSEKELFGRIGIQRG